MKKTWILTLMMAALPLAASANGENLVTAFETYCLKQTGNVLALDKAVSEKTDRHHAERDMLRNQRDVGYFMQSGGRQYLVEWNDGACRVSTDDVQANEVLKALASKHILSVPHGDNTDFGRAHWFGQEGALTRYAFTHDLNGSTIVFEYLQANATMSGPVAITLTR